MKTWCFKYYIVATPNSELFTLPLKNFCFIPVCQCKCCLDGQTESWCFLLWHLSRISFPVVLIFQLISTLIGSSTTIRLMKVVVIIYILSYNWLQFICLHVISQEICYLFHSCDFSYFFFIIPSYVRSRGHIIGCWFEFNENEERMCIIYCMTNSSHFKIIILNKKPSKLVRTVFFFFFGRKRIYSLE